MRSHMTLPALVCVVVVMWQAGPATPDHGPPPREPHLQGPPTHVTRLPLAFVPNHGQWETDARYVARRGSFLTQLEQDAIVVQLQRLDTTPSRTHEHAARRVSGLVARMTFERARPDTLLVGERELPGTYNYFVGPNSSSWHTGIRGYSSVRYHGLYDGVDLRVREGDNLAYDLLLSPGADLDQVVVRCDGIDSLAIDSEGRLLMETARGPIEQETPITWEVGENGDRRSIHCEFVLLGTHHYGFRAPGRDHTLAMVIDPGLSWSTFLGGGLIETPVAMDLLPSGDVVVAGNTSSFDFPTSAGAFDDIVNVGGGFVSQISADGSTLVFSTMLEGTAGSSIAGLDVAADGSIVVTGASNAGFPVTTNAYNDTFTGGSPGGTDAVVARLDPSGSRLLYSTYIGANGIDVGVDLVAGGGERLTIVGRSCFSSFPTTRNALDQTPGGTCDGFVSQLDTSLVGSDQLVYSTFLGGSLADEPYSIRELGDGTFVVTGETDSGDFPTTRGAYDTTHDPASGGFIARFASDFAAMIYGTYVPRFSHYAISNNGEVTGVGTAGSPGFTASPGAYDETFNGLQDIVAARFDATGSEQLWLTYLGGSGNDTGAGVAIDNQANTLILGQVGSADFPTTPDAFDSTLTGLCDDGTVSYLSADGSQLLYSTYIGGPSSTCTQLKLAVMDDFGNAIVSGRVAANFPTTIGAFQEVHGGSIEDISLTRIPVSSIWQSLGLGLPGSSGTPVLTGIGPLCGGEDVTLKLSRAVPNGTATLVIGLSQLGASFKGGTLVPQPDLIVAGLPIDSSGKLIVTGTWPHGIPSGVSVYFQYWIQDAVGVAGFAASGGLLGTSTATLTP